MGLASDNVTSLASVPPAGEVDDCGALYPGFKFLALLFNHTMRMMMMTIVTTSSTASNEYRLHYTHEVVTWIYTKPLSGCSVTSLYHMHRSHRDQRNQNALFINNSYRSD